MQHYHYPTRRLGRDYNFCGYDPRGERAHVAAHLYGPGYRGPDYPAHLIPPRFSGTSQAPPRYGSPNLHQIPWLPANFVPHIPPYYFGKPHGPYLPAPLHFNPEFIGALVSRPRRHELSGELEDQNLVNEVQDGGE